MPQKVTSSVDASIKVSSLTVEDLLSDADSDGVYDLLGIGFGPASLAIAIAIHDILDQRALVGNTTFAPKVKFLERQDTFGWHSGMLLPGTKMQISFIKDLATVRNPRSYFTFLNYLKEHNRLVQFTNLDTFLPLRIEFEDYLKWAAYHFENTVEYSRDVLSVKPIRTNGHKKFDCLEVTSKDLRTGEIIIQRGRNAVIAVGGRPSIPAVLPQKHSKIIHSSRYNHQIGNILPNNEDAYRIAVIGGGQSAAEIFNDLQTRYPNAKTSLLMRDTALRPSDDSPFVNEVFNPEAVDDFYSTEPEVRAAQLKTNKATNYSVVRLNLLEQLYQQQYEQRLQDANPENWQHRILPSREIINFTDDTSNGHLELTTKTLTSSDEAPTLETHPLDAIILATGYIRDTHNQILQPCDVINGSTSPNNNNKNKPWEAARDYKVLLNRDLVEDDVQIYLQGCNEQTHGLSDTLLSILATRGGEIVDSIFGGSIAEANEKDRDLVEVERRGRDRSGNGNGRVVGVKWKLVTGGKGEKESDVDGESGSGNESGQQAALAAADAAAVVGGEVDGVTG